MTNQKINIGERIHLLRRRNKLSIRHLAEKLATSPTNVMNYEKGAYLPSSELIIKLANTFNVSTDFLLLGHDALEIADRDLIDKLVEADKLNEPSKQSLKQIIQSFLESHHQLAA